jgi:hypothetical protein
MSDNQDIKNLTMMVGLLLDRLGGSITFTVAELESVDLDTELLVQTPSSFNDDTVTLSLVNRGS